MLYLSLLLFLAVMILSFPFPNKYPFGESVFSVLNLPIRFAGGFHSVGMISLLLLIIAWYLLMKSLSKNKGWAAAIVITVVFFAPGAAVSLFQTTFATGIYAISYSSEESNCSFDMISEEILHGECELSLKNNSNKDVQFTVEFDEDLGDDPPMVSLMNADGPHEVMLKRQENKSLSVSADIDMSDRRNHIEGGEATGVDIIIKSKGKSREL